MSIFSLCWVSEPGLVLSSGRMRWPRWSYKPTGDGLNKVSSSTTSWHRVVFPASRGNPWEVHSWNWRGLTPFLEKRDETKAFGLISFTTKRIITNTEPYFALSLQQAGGGCPDAASYEWGDPWSSLVTGNTVEKEAAMGFLPLSSSSPASTAMTQPCREVSAQPHPAAGQCDGG